MSMATNMYLLLGSCSSGLSLSVYMSDHIYLGLLDMGLTTSKSFK